MRQFFWPLLFLALTTGRAEPVPETDDQDPVPEMTADDAWNFHQSALIMAEVYRERGNHEEAEKNEEIAREYKAIFKELFIQEIEGTRRQYLGYEYPVE